ncbi:LuxR C-terminal-related transcriptional regulator [Allonocardiopsis opalescens]|uniref:LuxR family maltose regulon positive regulatory protein n=1 Tax=Allonocardiopsis opalescens TaxID=1144618 RepID=A0A2T0PVX9_9ACTN|nr:LuxR C-terminal-related transcriptional regulator [Allonocardiopsis opalescens]PRX95667.1 LuxR family maltose regulon positive regulatory protein [Allonocardiopsis opalescens]
MTIVPPQRTRPAAGPAARPAPLARGTVPRPRLWRALDDAVRRPVTLVRAPGGYGKTVLCASWAARAPLPVAWLTVDALDREPERFWTRAEASLGAVGVRPRTPTGAGPPPERPVALVLDDVAEIDGSAALAEIVALALRGPGAPRLVLSGRALEALPAARLRLGGELTVLDAADLAATEEEVRRLLAAAGRPAAGADARRVLRDTAGWIAGVRLAGLPAAVVTDYVREELLAASSPADRRFLLRASVAEELTGELAEVLTGEPGGAAALERLSRGNGFLAAVPGSSGEPDRYRQPPVVRRVLRAELERREPASVPALRGALSDWHRSRGALADALACAAGSGDGARIRRLLAEDDLALILAGERGTRLLRSLPAGLVGDDAALPTALAIASVRAGDTAAAAAHLELAEAVACRGGDGDRWTREVKHRALRLLTAPGHPGHAELDRAAALATGGADPGRAGRRRRAPGWLLAVVGLARLREGRLAAARRCLALADRELTAGGLPALARRVLAWRAVAEALDGRYTAAEALAESVGEGRSPVRLAEVAVLLGRGDAAAAAATAGELEEWAAEPLLGEPPPGPAAQLARLAAGFGDRRAEAVRELARLREAEGTRLPLLHPLVRLLDPDGLPDRAGGPWPPEFAAARAVARARAALPGDPGAALRAVAGLLDEAGAERAGARRTEWIAALLAAAAARWRQGRDEEAAALLERALAAAEADGAVRVFLAAGAPARALLTALVPPGNRFHAFRRTVLRRFAGTAAPRRRPVPDGERLTGSERTVLRFLPSHQTYQEIAADLYLSVNTVKTHLRSVYRKLGVDSRRAAIAEAERRGLL